LTYFQNKADTDISGIMILALGSEMCRKRSITNGNATSADATAARMMPNSVNFVQAAAPESARFTLYSLGTEHKPDVIIALEHDEQYVDARAAEYESA
jgi:hypothetical protein